MFTWWSLHACGADEDSLNELTEELRASPLIPAKVYPAVEKDEPARHETTTCTNQDSRPKAS